MRRAHLLLSFLLLLALLPWRMGAAAPKREAFATGELIVGLRKGYTATALALPAEARLAVGRDRLAALQAVLVKVPAGQEMAFRSKLQALTGVRYVEPNYRIQADLIPDDARWSEQYGPVRVQAPAAWDLTAGSVSVILAVIDSGLDASHPEFAGRILPGYDFVERDAVPQDACGHGTHVAGIAAATGDDGEGIAGMAWGVQLLPIRVLDAYCSGTVADAAEGIVAAVERGAQVINLSLGTGQASTLLENATFYAYSHGAAIIAAAGNTGGDLVYPARYPWVLAVGATDASDLRWGLSAYGPELDLMAPGVDILSTLPFGPNNYGKAPGYDTLTGTSMAAPHVAGAAALLASLPQFASPDAIYEALTATALDLDTPGWDSMTGHGLLQTYAALTYTPTVSPTSTPDPPAVAYDVLDTLACPNLVSYSWRDAARYGEAVGLFSGMNGITLPLPFSFSFGGQDYTTVQVTPDGYLTFDGQGGIGDNFFLPGPAQPNNFLAVYWDDLRVDPTEGRSVYRAVFGAAPSREFVIEWNNLPHCTRYWGSTCVQWSGGLTVEAVLFEGSNEILFLYRALSPSTLGGASATIGLEYADGRAASQWSYNQAGGVETGLALRFVPYAPGDPLPSAGCASLVRPIAGGDVYWQPPFCVIIPPPLPRQPAVLRLAYPVAAPSMPATWLDLNRKADVRLQISPPPPISPTPEVYVCYQYTPEDVLRAGGHVENLFLAVYDAAARHWQALPTSVNNGNGTIFAPAPHFSYYGVAARAPQQLPVTGARQTKTGHEGRLWPALLAGAGGWILWRARKSRRCS